MDNKISSENSLRTTKAGETTPVQETTITGTKQKHVHSDYQTDFIDQTDIVIQEFSTTNRGNINNVYTATAQFPTLLLPDLDNGPQPFEPSWQKAVNKFFKDLVREHLIKKAKESNSSASQEMDSAEIEKQLNFIVKAFINGKKETLSESQLKIVSSATEETQKAWSLPASWAIGTQKIKDWTPIKINVKAPISIEKERMEILVTNVNELLLSLNKASKKTMDQLPPDDPNRLAIADLTRIISEAIRDLKSVLRSLQLGDSDIAKEVSKAKYEQVEDRKQENQRMSQKRSEATEKRRKQEQTAKIMKIVGPIVSAIVILVGVILLPFTAGGSTALIIAGIAVATVSLAYTVADAAFDLSSKIGAALSSFLNNLCPDKPWVQTLVKVLLVAVLVAVLIAAVAASGGGALAAMGSTITAQVVKQAAIEAAKRLVIQFTVMAIMSSNIIPELFIDLLIKTGAIDAKDEKAKMIAQIIIMAVTMVALMGIVSTKGASIKGIKDGFREVGKSLKAAGKSISKGAQELAESLKKLSKQTDAMKTLLANAVQLLESVPGRLTASMKEFLEGLKSFLTVDKKSIATTIQDTAMIAGLGTEIYGGIHIGILGIELSKIYEKLGLIEEAGEVIKMLLKLFEELLNSFQEQIGNNSEWLSSLQNALDSVHASATQTFNKAGHTAA